MAGAGGVVAMIAGQGCAIKSEARINENEQELMRICENVREMMQRKRQASEN